MDGMHDTYIHTHTGLLRIACSASEVAMDGMHDFVRKAEDDLIKIEKEKTQAVDRATKAEKECRYVYIYIHTSYTELQRLKKSVVMCTYTYIYIHTS
jgi:hypothetical protein